MKQRISKAEACERLGKSLTSLDRMISRGELETDLEVQGNRHRVWILMDEEEKPANTLPDTLPITMPKASLIASANAVLELEVVTLNERVKTLEKQVGSLEELETYHRGLLTEKDRQLQEVLASLKSAQTTAQQLSAGLPALQEPTGERKNRRWWPFG